MYHIKKDKRSVQSSNWIYEALSELMGEKPFPQITVTEVVERAGLGRATFYRSFDSLEDVLHMKCDERLEQLVSLFSDHANRKAKACFPGVEHGARIFLRFWYMDSLILEQLIQASRYDVLYRSLEKAYTQIIHEVPETKEIDARQMEYLLAAICGASIAILMRWIQNGKDIPPDDLADFMEETDQKFLKMAQERASSPRPPARPAL